MPNSDADSHQLLNSWQALEHAVKSVSLLAFISINKESISYKARDSQCPEIHVKSNPTTQNHTSFNTLPALYSQWCIRACYNVSNRAKTRVSNRAMTSVSNRTMTRVTRNRAVTSVSTCNGASRTACIYACCNVSN